MPVAQPLAISGGKSVMFRHVGSAAGCLLIGGVLLFGTGCQSNPSPGGPSGGPVVGALDVHCQGASGPIIQPVNASSCHPMFDMASSGMADMGAAQVSEYGETQYNAEGNDDDCKYRVKFSVNSARKGGQSTITTTITNLATNQPVSGAMTRAEVFLSDIHPAPNSGADTTESAPGTYVIGPIQFDASGRWTVRFHYFEDCSDNVEDSPHGHIAFYVDVP